MKKKIAGLLFAITLFLLLSPVAASAQTQSGFHLVTCGAKGQNPCTFNDLFLLLVRFINLLFAAAAIVAIWYVLNAAWDMVTALGRPDKITKGKDALTHAVIGFAIILLSFAFINLLLGLFGIKCTWWSPSAWQDTQSFYKVCIAPFQ